MNGLSYSEIPEELRKLGQWVCWGWAEKPLKMLGGAISLPNIYDLCHREGFPCLHIGKKLLVPVQAAYEWFQQQKN